LWQACLSKEKPLHKRDKPPDAGAFKY